MGDCSFLLGCIRFSKTVPVLFITCLVVWSYYAYVIQLCILIYIVFYHVFLLFFLWSYYMTIFARIKKPSEEFYLSETDIYEMNMMAQEETPKSYLEKRAKNLPVFTRTLHGAVRYCDKCKCIKPDRSHHCGVCQTCVLKMDHHCPWVNNCVGYDNYKYFLLFLFYSVLYCVFVAATSIEYFIQFWSEIQKFQASRFNLLFLFFIATMFGLSIISLLVYHIYLAAKNRTTLESFRPPVFMATGLPDKNGYDLGVCANLREIFGDSWLKALLPIPTMLNDGIYYQLSNEQTMALAAATNNSYLTATNPNSTDSLLLNNRYSNHHSRISLE